MYIDHIVSMLHTHTYTPTHTHTHTYTHIMSIVHTLDHYIIYGFRDTLVKDGHILGFWHYWLDQQNRSKVIVLLPFSYSILTTNINSARIRFRVTDRKITVGKITIIIWYNNIIWCVPRRWRVTRSAAFETEFLERISETNRNLI